MRETIGNIAEESAIEKKENKCMTTFKRGMVLAVSAGRVMVNHIVR